MKRPNILFIFTDQQRPDAIGLANPKIRTPAIDSIGLEGAYFSQACCNAPVCMPSRHSLFSGLYPSVLGNTCNGIEMPRDVPIFPHYLKEAGYWTANIGKLHFLNHSNRDHSLPHPDYGFDLLVNSDEPGCYDDAYIDWIRARAPGEVDRCRCSSPPICEGPRHELEPRETDQPYAFRGPEELTHSAFVAEQSIQAIREAPQGRPWFVCAGFYAPHAPVNPPKRIWDSYDPEDMPLPAWPEKLQPKDGGAGARGKTEAQWRRIISAYYALTTHVDEQIKKLLDFLREQDLEQDTLVVFTSDHGEFLGDYGQVQKGPPGHDCIMRVPLVIRWPGRIPAGLRSDAPVELVDLAPTFLDLARVPVPGAFQGKSLRPLLEGGQYWERKSCYQEFEKDGLRWRTVRMGPHTYAASSDNEEILWNRQRDTREFLNLAEDPLEAAALQRLRKELDSRTPTNRRTPPPRTGAY
ncbi:MAG: sulfatase family protein [Oceanipulchritudo sp.]